MKSAICGSKLELMLDLLHIPITVLLQNIIHFTSTIGYPLLVHIYSLVAYFMRLIKAKWKMAQTIHVSCILWGGGCNNFHPF